MPSYGMLTNPSNEILKEITNIHDLNFEYVEVGIEGPEGNPLIIEKKKNEILNLLQKFKGKPIGHTAYWIDLCSDYEYVRSAWIQEAMREIGIAKMIGIDLINFHANLNGMFYGEKRKDLLQAVTDYINIFKDKIIHIHWHDNHGNKDEHLPIGAGLIDHQRAIKELKNIEYDRTITLEVFTSSSDAKASANDLRTMWDMR